MKFLTKTSFMFVALMSLLMLLSACHDDNSKNGNKPTQSAPQTPQTSQPSQTPKEQLAALEDSGAIPKLDRTDSIAGIDADGNGIRDDIDAFIQAKYSEPAQRRAVQQLARALQAAILVAQGDRDAAKDVSIRVGRAIHCIVAHLPDSGSINSWKAPEEIEAMTANTKKRSLAYVNYNNALDGTVSSLPKGNTCE